MSDMDRLIEHIAVLGIALRDDDTESAYESWRSLPDHLQILIYAKEQEIDEDSDS